MDNLDIKSIKDLRHIKGLFRRGRNIFAISIHDHNWREEGAYYKRRWVDHLTERTESKTLYMIEVPKADWEKVRHWDITGDYIRIERGNTLVVLMEKPPPTNSLTAQALTAENRKSDLECLIPDSADKKAVSTSRQWKLLTKAPKQEHEKAMEEIKERGGQHDAIHGRNIQSDQTTTG